MAGTLLHFPHSQIPAIPQFLPVCSLDPSFESN